MFEVLTSVRRTKGVALPDVPTPLKAYIQCTVVEGTPLQYESSVKYPGVFITYPGHRMSLVSVLK